MLLLCLNKNFNALSFIKVNLIYYNNINFLLNMVNLVNILIWFNISFIIMSWAKTAANKEGYLLRSWVKPQQISGALFAAVRGKTAANTSCFFFLFPFYPYNNGIIIQYNNSD